MTIVVYDDRDFLANCLPISVQIYEGQSKITESWLISFFLVGSFGLNLIHISNQPLGLITYRS